jgi:hypothetical protein
MVVPRSDEEAVIGLFDPRIGKSTDGLGVAYEL